MVTPVIKDESLNPLCFAFVPNLFMAYFNLIFQNGVFHSGFHATILYYVFPIFPMHLRFQCGWFMVLLYTYIILLNL
jgi:hypothetical protein